MIKPGSWIAKLAAWYMNAQAVALVLGRTIHLSGTTKEQFLQNHRWVKHELRHVEQYEQHGFVLFLLKYLWWSLRYGYRNNPLEKDARDAENEPLPVGVCWI